MTAQRADFSGKWTFNESKSEIGALEGQGRGGFMAFSGLTVLQDAGKIEIERTRTGRDGQEITTSETLTLDGKENLSENERGSTKTTATWSGDGQTLTFNVVRTMNFQDQSMEMTSSEIWTLTDGGKTLTIESTSTTPMGGMTNTFVYDKS